jgi:hypothetical protein
MAQIAVDQQFRAGGQGVGMRRQFTQTLANKAFCEY